MCGNGGKVDVSERSFLCIVFGLSRGNRMEQAAGTAISNYRIQGDAMA